MKAIATILSALALTNAVTAQSGFDDLPACGKTCINNLLDMSSDFGCTSGSSDEANCLCANADFTYGIRDCSNQACSDTSVASSVISYGVNYCASAGVAIPTTIATVTSGIISPTVTSTPSGAGSATTGSGSASGSVTAVAVATSSYLTTETTDGSTLTTSVVSTIFSSGAAALSSSASSVASSASSVASSVSSDAGSIASSASSVASSASSAASAAGSSASSAGSAAASSATGTGSSSSSSGLAPQMTAAPIGFLAAAGVAAMLL